MAMLNRVKTERGRYRILAWGERAVTTTIRIDEWTNKRNAKARSRASHVAKAQVKGETITMK